MFNFVSQVSRYVKSPHMPSYRIVLDLTFLHLAQFSTDSTGSAISATNNKDNKDNKDDSTIDAKTTSSINNTNNINKMIQSVYQSIFPGCKIVQGGQSNNPSNTNSNRSHEYYELCLPDCNIHIMHFYQRPPQKSLNSFEPNDQHASETKRFENECHILVIDSQNPNGWPPNTMRKYSCIVAVEWFKKLCLMLTKEMDKKDPKLGLLRTIWDDNQFFPSSILKSKLRLHFGFETPCYLPGQDFLNHLKSYPKT